MESAAGALPAERESFEGGDGLPGLEGAGRCLGAGAMEAGGGAGGRVRLERTDGTGEVVEWW